MSAAGVTTAGLRGRVTASSPREALDPALAHLVANVDRLDLEEFCLRLFLRGPGFLDLNRKLGKRAFEVIASNRGGPGVGGISEVTRIGDAGALLFGPNFAIEFGSHPSELDKHHFDLPHPPALFFELKAL